MFSIPTKHFLTLSLFFLVNATGHGQGLSEQISLLKPELFLPNKVSTGDFDYGAALSADGKTFVYIKAIQGFQRASLVYITKDEKGVWSSPQLVPFSGTWYDTNPYFSQTGDRFYFVSDRPSPNASHERRNLWYTMFKDGKFEEPQIEETYNGAFDVIYPTIDRQDNIRYCTFRPEGKGGLDLYRVTKKEGKYGTHLPIEELNTSANDADPEVSPNGNLLIFTSTRPGGMGHFDLYIAKKEGDQWGKPINMESINSPYMDSDPIFSKDGKYLFFSSNRVSNENGEVKNYSELLEKLNAIDNGLMNIYRVDVSVLIKAFDN